MVIKGGDNVLKDCLDIFREELSRIAEKTGDEDRLISCGWRLSLGKKEWNA